MSSDRQLPDGWRWVRFGDVVRQVKDKVDPDSSELDRYVAGSHMDSDDLRLRRWGEIGDDYLGPAFHMRFKPGQVLYGSRRTYLRKVALPDFEGICANTTFVVEPASEDLHVDFLPHVMSTESFHQHSVLQSKGSVNPYINFRDLNWFEFALPPLTQQVEISRTLRHFEHVKNATAETQRAILLLRESILERLQRSDAPTRELGDLAHVVSGESFSASQSSDVPSTGSVPVLGIKNLSSEGRIVLEDVTHVEGIERDSLFLADNETLVVIRTNGNEDRVGNVYRATEEVEGFALSAFVFGCRFADTTQRDLAFEHMRGRRFQRWATSLVAGSTGLKNLPIKSLRTARIPLAEDHRCRDALILLQDLRRLEEAADAHEAHTIDLLKATRERLLSVGGGHV